MASDADGLVPVALPPLGLTELVDFILERHRYPTILVICSSRATFLDHLRASIHSDNANDGQSSQFESSSDKSHRLLTPTIHLLATSRTIDVAFAPTLPHLRAFLASQAPQGQLPSTLKDSERPSSRVPILAIFGLVALHRPTSDYSVQGLSRTLATAVETASAASMKLVIIEERRFFSDQVDEGMEAPTSKFMEDPWSEEVPILNSSSRFGREDSIWAGKTLKIGKILARWCKIHSPPKLSDAEDQAPVLSD